MTVIALAGRRTDATKQDTVRFPLSRVDDVRGRLHEEFVRERATILVSSAACGVDLIGQDVAVALGLRRLLVLPFEKARFRETSVTDRPGDWGPTFDRLVSSVSPGDIRVGKARTDDDAYVQVNEAILDLAQEVAKDDKVVAVVAWDGRRRDGDITGAFVDAARRRGIRLVAISTV